MKFIFPTIEQEPLPQSGKVKIVLNIWGNWNCYIGAKNVTKFASEFDAREWLADTLATGKYKLSDKSE